MRVSFFRTCVLVFVFFGLVVLSPQAVKPVLGDSPAMPAVGWLDLRELDYQSGKVPPKLQALNGKTVRVPGFMVPLEEREQAVTEFLLVPYIGACIHVPPPPPNQIVHVKMAEGKQAAFEWWVPVWVVGRFKIENSDSMWGKSSYSMTGIRTEPYEKG